MNEFSTFMISEKNAKLTRTLFLQHKGVDKKIDVPLDARIYDVKEEARQVFTMNQDYCVTITDEKKEVLPLGKNIIDVPDFSTLFLLEEDPQKKKYCRCQKTPQ